MRAEIDQLKDESNLAAFRARFFWASLIFLAGYTPFMVKNFWLGFQRVATIQLVCLIGVLSILLFERVTNSLSLKYWSSHGVLGCTLAAGFFGGFFSGQEQAVSAWVLLLGPIFAAYLLGSGSAKVWTGLSILGLFILHYSGRHYPIPPEFVASGPRVLGVQVILTLVIFSLGRALRVGVERQVDVLKRQSAALAQAQNELERSCEEARNLEIARQQFVELLAHDMRNPITGIVGYAQLLSFEDGIGEEGRKMLEGIEDLTRDLTGKLSDILDVSRLEHEGLDLRLSEVDYIGLCHEVLEELDQEFLPAVELESPDTILLNCDPRLLRRVLANLLSNAQRFCEEGGRVRLRVVESEREVITDVIDNGPALSAEEKGRAFQGLPYSGDKPSKRSSGLGLTLCKLAIEKHGGTLGLEEPPEGGCQFRFTLPRLLESLPSEP